MHTMNCDKPRANKSCIHGVSGEWHEQWLAQRRWSTTFSSAGHPAHRTTVCPPQDVLITTKELEGNSLHPRTLQAHSHCNFPQTAAWVAEDSTVGAGRALSSLFFYHGNVNCSSSWIHMAKKLIPLPRKAHIEQVNTWVRPCCFSPRGRDSKGCWFWISSSRMTFSTDSIWINEPIYSFMIIIPPWTLPDCSSARLGSTGNIADLCLLVLASDEAAATLDDSEKSSDQWPKAIESQESQGT